jgi:hypothetical protein
MVQQVKEMKYQSSKSNRLSDKVSFCGATLELFGFRESQGSHLPRNYSTAGLRIGPSRSEQLGTPCCGIRLLLFFWTSLGDFILKYDSC